MRVPDEAVRSAAQTVFDNKTKPRGSLGRIERLACDFAAIRGTTAPGRLQPAVVLAAGDHGVAAEEVSAYPQAVTGQMVVNIATGGAAISVIARETHARLVIVDCGTITQVEHPDVRDARAGTMTGNIARGPAMPRRQALDLIAAGAALAGELAGDGVNLIALGEMGIANTTSASSLCAAFLGADAAVVCGRGAGIDEERLAHKIDVVRQALASNPPDATDPVGTLAALGGFEIAYLTGVTLGAATESVPILLDGFITGAAALAAARIAPAVTGSMVAAHRSQEPGHRLVLDELGLTPVFDLDLRLGEGTGAALCVPLISAALALFADMATFDSAGVTDAGA